MLVCLALKELVEHKFMFANIFYCNKFKVFNVRKGKRIIKGTKYYFWLAGCLLSFALPLLFVDTLSEKQIEYGGATLTIIGIASSLYDINNNLIKLNQDALVSRPINCFKSLDKTKRITTNTFP